MSDKLVAVRVLHVEGDLSKTHRVEIFMPVEISKGIFQCQIRIEGAPDGMNTVNFSGQDSYQALVTAIQTIPVLVDVFNKRYIDTKLRWFPNSEDLHFKLDLIDQLKSEI